MEKSMWKRPLFDFLIIIIFFLFFFWLSPISYLVLSFLIAGSLYPGHTCWVCFLPSHVFLGLDDYAFLQRLGTYGFRRPVYSNE